MPQGVILPYGQPICQGNSSFTVGLNLGQYSRFDMLRQFRPNVYDLAQFGDFGRGFGRKILLYFRSVYCFSGYVIRATAFLALFEDKE